MNPPKFRVHTTGQTPDGQPVYIDFAGNFRIDQSGALVVMAEWDQSSSVSVVVAPGVWTLVTRVKDTGPETPSA